MLPRTHHTQLCAQLRVALLPLMVWLAFIESRGWPSLSHGAAETNGLDLGNLNPIYARELNKPDVRQRKGRWNVSMDGEGRSGCRRKGEEDG